MKLVSRKTFRLILAAVLAASYFFSPLSTAFADTPIASVQSSPVSTLQSLAAFARSVTNGRRQQLVGVYSPNIMSFPVVQQPGGDSAYVSMKANTLTQFGIASQYGSTGLLAHNTLAGADFFKLQYGDILSVVYGDGSISLFKVSQIQKYQALEPNSPYSNFVDLSNPGAQLTNTELFYRVYGQDDVLVFQTCIARDGNNSWGRIFIIASPLQGNPADYYKSYGFGKVSGKINAQNLALSANY